jgi:adenine-specific DNA methylase
MRLKKRRGVVYTPARLAEFLAAWSVRSKDDLVLEPSFGGCGFIAALQKRFAEVGNKTPLKNIFGCDVDAAAFKRHLPGTIGADFDKKHFRKADFLSLDVDAFPINRFTAVLGNPPYVSYHNMFRTQRFAASMVGNDKDFRLSGMASLWAHFVFHSLKFLREKGRMGWLLPGSLLHADYGKELLHELSWRFERIAVISLQERIFLSDGVSETTEVLICDGYRSTRFRGEVEIVTAENLNDCARFLEGWQTNDWRGVPLNGRAVLALTRAQDLSAFETISARADVVTLGGVGRVAIGIVTGANRIFVINEASAERNRIPEVALKPIFAKFGISSGIRLVSKDLSAARKGGAASLLVDGARAIESKAVRSYFDAVPKALREKNVTFTKHADWRCPDDNRIPDAFFPYMHHVGPRIILNKCGINATNTIHRVYFKPGISAARRKLIALSLLSSFSQLSAEIEGRSYGGGVLKHEPTEATRIRLILPELTASQISEMFRVADDFLRRGLADEATALVDRKLLSSMVSPPTKSEWNSVHAALKRIRSRRHRS